MSQSLPTTVLVANRGEIACRIFRTLRRLGIRSVAVYSDADADAKHVRAADHAIRIGEPPASSSYLNTNAIIAAAVETGAEAVHPGYGFGAENPAFAGAIQEAGLHWIGPHSEVIAKLGDKVAARQAFASAGFPMAEASGRLRSPADAIEAARRIGFPVLVKPALGGGGIGMQVADDEEALAAAVSVATTRGRQFFGDGSVYLERFFPGARHVEFQVIVDSRGEATHLYERECSVQRRRQKLIEEAPSPGLDDDAAKAFAIAAADALARLNYVGVGTVECLLAQDGQLSFLEVNTRLQVEHGITEELTGVDLVEAQITLATGEPLPFATAPHRSGHALECRICAEDPVRFLPSPGRIEQLTLPSGVRCDFGYDAGDVVPPFYDSLIGKLIVKGETRPDAIQRMEEALAELSIEGIKTNTEAHLSVLRTREFVSGEYTTELLDNGGVPVN